ncbi:MAG: ZIP family magnesium transporter [Candidatus Rokuibacteriota bacterium]|nr:MAG: ZIP family magnesium transporter [Candidatus Rokubacteria bacterium]
MLAYLAFAAVAAAADVAGAAIVTRAHKHGHARLRYFVAGGAGFMLAAAFVRMLPESTHVPHAFLFVLLGYFGGLAVFGLGVHTVFDGVAIAAGFMVSASLGAVLFLAVMLHKLPEGFTIASIMLAGGHSRGAALAAGTGLGVLTLAGALATSLIAQHHIAYALALSAGVTIYVAASDLIPEVNREDDAPGLAYTVFAGLLFFVAVDWAFSELLGH